MHSFPLIPFGSIVPRICGGVQESGQAGGEDNLQARLTDDLPRPRASTFSVRTTDLDCSPPPLHAKREKSIHTQPDDPLSTRPSIPVSCAVLVMNFQGFA
jgi:hypothetical protein